MTDQILVFLRRRWPYLFIPPLVVALTLLFLESIESRYSIVPFYLADESVDESEAAGD
jgi:hypothetical protein